MLESVVTTVLNRLVGSYVENFDPKQLKIALLSGDVRLSNLRLKREALDKLHLPLNVIDGHIGSLVLQIPYSNFKSKPVRIVLEDVFVLAVPDMSLADSPDAQRRELREKLDRLATWELAENAKYEEATRNKPTGAHAEADPQNQTYLGNLVSKIIDNLQVTIKNIHVRYQDDEAVPNHPFAMGLTLAELSAVSTDSNWEPAFISEITAITHKLATLDAFAVYWETDASDIQSDNESRDELHDKFRAKIADHSASEEYIMRPVNGQGFITLDKAPAQESKPKIHANLQFEEFALGLDRTQYRDMLALGDQMNLYFRTRQYRKNRPSSSPKDAPVEWFRYAAQSVLDNVRERRRKWSWEFISERITDLKLYKDLYKKKYTSGELKGTDKAHFDELQAKYLYQDLVLFRSLAKQELRSESVRQKVVTEGKRQAASWSSWLWGGGPKEEHPALKDEEPLEITDKDKKDLYDALELDNDILGTSSAQQVLLQAEVSLNSGGLRLTQKGLSNSSVGSISFDGSKLKLTKRQDSFLFSLSLDSLELADLTNDSKFPKVVQVYERRQPSKDDSSAFFRLLFEQNPMDTIADSNLFIKSRSVEIVHNVRFLEAVIMFFTPPTGKNETVDAILNAANQTVEELREQTRAGLEYALEMHKTVNVKLDIEAPVIVIPLNVQQADSPVTIIDAGHLSMTSNLVKKEVLDEVKSKQAHHYTDEDWRRLESLMYDRFNIRLEAAQLIIGPEYKGAMHQLAASSSALHVLDKTTLDFLFELSIVPRAASLPRSRLSIRLPTLKMSLADVQYKQLMQTIDAAKPVVDPVEEQAEDDDSFFEHNKDSVHHSQSPEPSGAVVKRANPKGQRLFELRLTVETASLSLTRDWTSIPIIDISLRETNLNFWSEDSELGVDMTVSDLLIEDLFNKGGPGALRKIAQSEGLIESPHESDVSEPSTHESGVKHLFKLTYARSEKPDHIEQTVDVALAAIQFVLTPTVILTIYDYIMSTFTTPDQASPSDKVVEDAAVTSTSDTIKVVVSLSSISALLNDEDIVISKLQLDSAKLFVDLIGPILRFKTVLGAVSVTDEINNGSDVDSVIRQLVGIEGGGELADFRYESLGPNSDKGYNSLVYFRSGSLKLSIVEEPLVRLVHFFSKFTQMKMIYDQARMMAFDQAIQIENPDKIKFDVVVSSPIIIYPRVGGGGYELLRANLGEIYLQNSFLPIEGSGVLTNDLEAGIRGMHLLSQVEVDGETKSMEILHDADLAVKMSFVNAHEGMKRPVAIAESSFAPTTVKVTEYQYKYMMQFVSTLQQIAEGTNGLDDEEVGDLKKELVDQKHLSKGQTTFWSNQAGSSSVPSTQPDAEADQLSFAFDAPSFTVNLYTCAEPVKSDEELQRAQLSSFELNELNVKVAIDKKNFLEVDALVKSFTVTDTRVSRESKFPHVVPLAKHEDHQFICRYTKGAKGPPTLNVSLDSPQIIVALDYLFAMQNFLSTGLSTDRDPIGADGDVQDDDIESVTSEAPSVPRTDSSRTTAATNRQQGEDFVGNFRPLKRAEPPINLSLSIVDTYFTILADASNENSEAIVFKVEHVIAQLGQSGSLSISQVGLFLTTMQNYQESKLRLLNDFNITVSIEDLDSNEYQSLTKLNANIEPLIVRLSLREILLALAIFEKASRLWSEPELEDAVIDPGSANFTANGQHPVTKTIASKKTGMSTRASRKVATAAARPAGRSPRVQGEHLQAEFEGIRFVLIEPQNQIPISDFRMDAFTVNVRNWSSNLRIDAAADLHSGIFNFPKSSWEPLVDKISLGLNITKMDEASAPQIDLFTKNNVNFEITPTSLDMFNDISEYFASKQEHIEDVFKSSHEDVGYPYLVHNRTEFPLKIWSDAPDSKHKIHDVLTVDAGADLNWRFHDWKSMREASSLTSSEVSFGVSFIGSQFEDLRQVSANLVGESLYLLNSGKKERQAPRLACEVYVENYVKHVVLRSTMVVCNNTEVDLELRLVPATVNTAADSEASPISLRAGGSYALPIHMVDSEIYIRPDPKLGFNWSTQPIVWRRLRSEDEALECVGGDGTNFFVQAAADFSEDIPLREHYPYMNITLTAPFEIINNLPYDMEYRLYSRDTKQDWTNFIRKGATSPVHVVTRNHLLLLSAQVHADGLQRSEFAIISSNNRQFEREEWLSLESEDGHRLKLQLKYVTFPKKRGFAIIILSPYVLLNNTGQKLVVSTRVNRVICPVNSIEVEGTVQRQAQPVMWSFDSPDANNKAMLKVDDSHWSAPVSFTAVGRVTEVAVASRNRQSSYHLGFNVSAGEGRYKLSRVVTITPRFILNNKLGRAVRYREPGAVDALSVLEPGHHKPVGFISNMSNNEMCLSFTTENSSWSSSFVMSNIGTSYVRLYEKGKPTTLVKIEIALTHATLFIHLQNAGRKWPYSIRNLTDIEFDFYQSNPFVDEDGIERKNFTPIRYRLPARSVMPYSWDFPAAQLKELVLEVGRKRRRVQLAEIGELPPAKFPTSGGSVAVVDLSVVADGPMQALVLAPFEPEESNYRVIDDTRSVASSTGMAIDGDRVATTEVNDNDSASLVKFSLKGVGISYINRLNQEVCYASFRNVTFKYRVSDIYQTLSWQCQWIQVDNTLFTDTDFPVVIYPTVLPKTGEEMKQHPAFSGSVSRMLDDSYGLVYIKHATTLLQEMTIETDEDFLAAIIDMNRKPEDQMKLFHSDTAALCPDHLTLPVPSDESGATDFYFELLHLQPIQLNLSFARTGALSDTPFFADLTGPAAYLIDALTMAIGNINDASVKFNSLLMENVRTPLDHLLQATQTHYSQELLYQVHKIVGSVDVLGSPVGLFNNISSGVMDLFYEPYMGYTMTDRPQDLGIGIAKGGASFVKKSVFGVSNSISKVTGSLSKGIASITLDPAFQKKRRQSRTRNHPRHAIYGLSVGATSFANSFASGVTGLARAPLEGAATEGAAGFFKGIGKGIVGLPTKTAVGVLDFTSNFTEGIRNTTTLYDANAIARARLPRVIPLDGVVVPYDERAAVGQAILHSCDDSSFNKDNYLAHTRVTDSKTLVVSYQRILLVDMNNMRREWQIRYGELRSVVMEHSGLSLKLHDNVQGPFIPLPDRDSRRYIYTEIGVAVSRYNRRRHVLY